MSIFVGCYGKFDEKNYLILSKEAKHTSQKFCPQNSRTYLIRDVTDFQQLQNQINFSEENAEDMDFLLDSIKWQVFVYMCGNNRTISHNLKTVTLNKFQNCCKNDEAFFTNEISQVLSHYPNCNVTRCKEHETPYYIPNWILVLCFGLVGLFGNAVVIHRKIKSIWTKSNPNKEIQIYNSLVLNLAISDMLMVIYLVFLAVEVRHKVTREVFFSEATKCNIFGVLSFLSSEVSLTLLGIISLFRLLSVVYPFQNQHFKIALSLICLAWLIWIPVSVIPTVEIEPFTTFFTSGIRNGKMTNDPDNYILAYRIQLLLENLSKLAPDGSDLRKILKTVLNQNKRNLSLKALEKLGILNTSIEAWRFIGYYNSKYSCSVSFLAHSLEILPQNRFTLSIVVLNVIVCIFILISYSVMAFNIFGWHVAMNEFCVCKNVTSNSCQRKRHFSINQRNHEDQKMFFLIFIVVITDLLCWIPLCALCFVFWLELFNDIGSSIYEELYKNTEKAILWIVPLNSVLNPYIYSFQIWQNLLTSFKKNIHKFSSCNFC